MTGFDDARFDYDQVLAFVMGALSTAGLTEDQANGAAEMLVKADLRGVASHGLGRLTWYVRRLQNGLEDPNAELTIDRESAATLALNANHGMGLLAGPRAMRMTIDRAKTSGLCLTTVRRSNHFGIAGTYAVMATEEGLGGMAMTNASRLVVPMFGREPRLGTNPIAFAVPTSGEPFVLDMSTSTVAWGKIEIARRAGLPIPEGWAVDPDGGATTDPHQAKWLTPLGGTRELAGHKGYGLAMMVDILCGPLGGNAWSNRIARPMEQTEPTGTGHTFMAWRIDAFRDPDEFRADMDEMVRELRETPRADDAPGPVLIPGDPESEAERRNMVEGIPVSPALRRELQDLARDLAIDDPFGSN
jgi:LDH2 family malate/lactate/ureidoglycolate dehydrogenase